MNGYVMVTTIVVTIGMRMYQNVHINLQLQHHARHVSAAYEISKNWHWQRFLIFALVNSKNEDKILPAAAISKNVGNTNFVICIRGIPKI